MYTPIHFTSEQLPNSHVIFTPDGVKLRITLNITPAMKSYLSPNNVFKAEKHWVYSISTLIPNPCFKALEKAYHTLMHRAMINCRDAKIKVIEKQQIQLIQSMSL